MENFGSQNTREDIYSKAVRAGKRTYFFDVKATRNEELYLTITESKKRFDQQTGKFFFEKHKIFLYREDFDKFQEALQEAFGAIAQAQPEVPQMRREYQQRNTDIDFEDLGGDTPDDKEEQD
ncbi:MAG: PUR family DNA/RNA-binding protein [Bacteroidales bacterium]|nr:PUR family DNA/RNA-binding protein [Bacteroidales bacterium]